jgi:dihydroxyacetone kinase-like protein
MDHGPESCTSVRLPELTLHQPVRRAKILNDPRDVVNEALEGLVAASHGELRPLDGATAVVRSRLAASRIGLLIGGGSGHEPLFAGFHDDDLEDAA